MTTTAQQQWNKGHVSRPTAPRTVDQPGKCDESACGSRDDAFVGRRPRGWLLVKTIGEPGSGRVYCSTSCATYGMALADLRGAQ